MRLVKQIPHSHFRISIYSWNEKYLLEIELDRYKQTYRWGHDEVENVDVVSSFLTPDFMEQVMGVFLQMRAGFERIKK